MQIQSKQEAENFSSENSSTVKTKNDNLTHFNSKKHKTKQKIEETLKNLKKIFFYLKLILFSFFLF